MALFDHYGTSELLLLDANTGITTTIGPPRLYIE